MATTRTIKCSISNHQGFKLDGRLDLPAKSEPSSMAILSHCFTCSKDILTAFRVSRGLAQAGIGVLRFDFTGLGNSEGDFANSNFTTMVDDILSTADYLQQHYAPPSTLIGHSMGGTAALVASTRLTSCRSVVTLASPSEPAHVLHHFGAIMEQLDAGQNAHINVAGVDYPVKPQFIDDVRNYAMQKMLLDYNKPLMAIRAGQDTLVGADDAEQILAYSQGETRLLDLPTADHLFSDRQDTETIIEAINAWIAVH